MDNRTLLGLALGGEDIADRERPRIRADRARRERHRLEALSRHHDRQRRAERDARPATASDLRAEVRQLRASLAEMEARIDAMVQREIADALAYVKGE